MPFEAVCVILTTFILCSVLIVLCQLIRIQVPDRGLVAAWQIPVGGAQ